MASLFSGEAAANCPCTSTDGLATGVAQATSVSAEAPDGGREIMGVRHKQHPTFGLQFHPESFLTPSGVDILRKFLAVRM